MADNNYSNDKANDAVRRNEEMAEGENSQVAAEIHKTGGKYYCPECHSELPVKQACPGCGKELDWDRIMLESR